MAFTTGGVKFKNLAECLAKLDQLDLKLKDALKLAARAGGDIVAKSAQEKAPKRTGRMAKSIKATKVRARGPIAKVNVSYAPKYFYGRFQEKGTSKMQANAFLVPALEESESQVIETARSVFRQAIARVTR